MPSTVAQADRGVSIGRVFRRGFGTIGAGPASVFGIVLLFGALPVTAITLLSQMRSAAEPFWTRGAAAFGASLVAAAFTALVQVAIIGATTAHHDGRPIRFQDSAMPGLRRILPLLTLGFLSALGVVAGTFLLILPGILLSLMWCVAAPALVAEDCSLSAAFGRSRFLSEGARWQVLAIELLLLVGYMAVAAVSRFGIASLYGFHALATLSVIGAHVAIFLISCGTSLLSMTVGAAIRTSLYVELREYKDGPASDALGAIFA